MLSDDAKQLSKTIMRLVTSEKPRNNSNYCEYDVKQIQYMENPVRL